MKASPDSIFYVYGLLRTNGTPFYIGKGKGDRMFRHVAEARRGHRCHKCNTIRKIIRSGGTVRYMTFWSGTDELLAFEQEKYWIAFFGVDTLTNGTHGGDGFTPDEDARKRMRVAALRRSANPSYRQKLSAANRRRWGDADYHQYMKAKLQTIAQTPEMRSAQSERSKENWRNPEYRKKVSDSIARYHAQNPKTPARHRRQKPRKSPDEVLLSRLNGIARRSESPTWRENLRKHAIKRGQNPEYREKMRLAALKRWGKSEHLRPQQMTLWDTAD